MKRIFAFICLGALFVSGATFKMRNGDTGVAHKIDAAAKELTVMATTLYDPKSGESQSTYKLKWTDQTVIEKRAEGIDMTTVAPGRVALFHLDPVYIQRIKEGKPFRCKRIEFLVKPQKPGWTPGGKGLFAPFYPKGKKNFEIEVDGKRIPGDGTAIEYTRIPMTAIQLRVDSLRMWVKDDGADQVLYRVEVTPRVDERKNDDRNLPSVLVVGDSISMNYNAAAKKLMQGKFNYHRIPINGGPSSRGVALLAMWLGDYRNPASKWDVVVLNHGLHDLVQEFDPATKQFKSKHLVELADYEANLRRELDFLAKTGLKLVWCMTTPVPNDGRAYNNRGRRKDEELKYNEVARKVLAAYPQVLICDLNAVVRNSSVFDEWRKGNNVHFKPGPEQETLAKAVTDAIIEAYKK